MLGALQAPYGQATLCMNLINLAMTSGLLDVDCAVIMAAELEAMTRTVATPALSFFPCYDHLGIFPSYLWLQDHYHLWTSLWLWSDCKSNGPFMVFVLLPLRMAACAKSGTIAVWFSFFLWADVQPAWLGWRWKGVIVLVFTAMQQLEKLKHLGENFEEISDRFASSFDFFCCYTNTDAEVFCKWQGCVIQEMITANLVLFN